MLDSTHTLYGLIVLKIRRQEAGYSARVKRTDTWTLKRGRSGGGGVGKGVVYIERVLRA